MFKADHKTRRGNEMMITTEQDFQQIYDSERASMSKNFTFFCYSFYCASVRNRREKFLSRSLARFPSLIVVYYIIFNILLLSHAEHFCFAFFFQVKSYHETMQIPHSVLSRIVE